MPIFIYVKSIYYRFFLHYKESRMYVYVYLLVINPTIKLEELFIKGLNGPSFFVCLRGLEKLGIKHLLPILVSFPPVPVKHLD